MIRLVHRSSLLALLAVGFTALAAQHAFGQELTGSIVGTVADESQALLPGATVTVVNVDNGVEQSLTTDTEGRYRATNLIPGAYEVRAALTGFRTTVRRGIHMEMGRTAVVDLLLVLGEFAEAIVVTGEAPLIDTAAMGLGHLVTRENIENLPLNGRSFQQLATLQPGVTVPTKMGSGGGAGAGTKIIASGMRANYTNYTMDGVDYNEVRNQSPASALGVVMGVEAVREFKVVTNSYSAEFGRNAGALVSITTRSGTNDFHGSVYEFHRNDGLDARNFFDLNKADFRRNQFGFLLAGPVIRNRTFFLVNYEGLRQSRGQSQIGLVPDADARQGIIPGRQRFTVDPAIAPVLAVYPMPNGASFGNGIGEYLSSGVEQSRQNFLMFRTDHTFSAGNSVYARYMIDRASVDSLNPLEHPSRDETRSRNLVVEATRIFGARWMGHFRFGYNAPSGTSRTASVEGIPEAIAGRGTSRFNVAGLTRTSGSTDGGRIQNAFQVNADVQYTGGKHSVKFGALAQTFRTKIKSSPAEYPGDWTAGSLESFLTNDWETVDVTAAQFVNSYDMRQQLFGFYVQDNWSVFRRLTFNLGLRYEFITAPTEEDGEIANFKEPRSGLLTPQDRQPSVGNPLFENPSLKNVGPRLGFAWLPFDSEKTAVRGGFGVYYQQILAGTWIADAMPPFSTSVRVAPGGRFPTIPADRIVDPPTTAIEPQFIDYFIDQPTVMHWNVGLAHEWIRSTVLTLGYSGSRGYHLTTRTNTNIFPYVRLDNGQIFFPTGTQRINPNWGSFGHTVSDRKSFYHSLQAGVQRRFRDGLAFQSSYTFSKATDEGSHETASATFRSFSRTSADPFDHTFNRGPADFDVRHSLVTNVVYELPFGPGRRFASGTTGLAAGVIGGWQLAGIATVATGSPFEVVLGFDHAGRGDRSAERPDLAPGVSEPTVNPGNPNQYFDIAQFAIPPARTLGTLGRNALIGPGLLTIDLTVAKQLPFGGSRRLDLRFDAFNLTNRTNFQVPTATAGTAVGGVALFNSRGRPLPQAARITTTTTTARQMQFSVRFVF